MSAKKGAPLSRGIMDEEAERTYRELDVQVLAEKFYERMLGQNWTANKETQRSWATLALAASRTFYEVADEERRARAELVERVNRALGEG